MSVRPRAKNKTWACGQQIFRNGPQARFGFTLVELLVVVALIAILTAMLMPVLANARDGGNRARCCVQLKELAAAALAYADDYSGRYVPAASDLYSTNPEGGKCRWHGWRSKRGKNFQAEKGPLWPYLGRCGGLKLCPTAKYLKTVDSVSGSAKANMFESGCGGYGYNAAYVGGTYYKNYGADSTGREPYEIASLASEIGRPSKTVMFADAAIATGPGYFQEYSFVEPPHHLQYAQGTCTVVEAGQSSPTMHFRHGGMANVAWCDGHVSCETMAFTWDGSNTYGADNRANNLGYIGDGDNRLFDNK